MDSDEKCEMTLYGNAEGGLHITGENFCKEKIPQTIKVHASSVWQYRLTAQNSGAVDGVYGVPIKKFSISKEKNGYLFRDPTI